ncbi:hypothetical protein CFREI_10635 [Corynebacterium freiburgense]|nr:hypothetical protein CFREI_10635 [Corynebacterium freiburgense]
MAQVLALLWFRSGLVRARVGFVSVRRVGFVSVDAGRFTFARGGKGRFNIAHDASVRFSSSDYPSSGALFISAFSPSLLGTLLSFYHKNSSTL